jgi:mRNA-degrading endonuclease toxin of MazEF toxin-antitoxin module
MRLFIPKGVGGTTMDCWAKCDQVHTIPKDVLTRQTGILPTDYFAEVEDRVKFSLGFESGFSSSGRIRVPAPSSE